MPKPVAKTPIRVTVNIGQGTPHQRRLWAKFWQKLIAEVKTSER